MIINKLISYLDEYLSVDAYQDYAPNGLQVSGAEEVYKIVTGVTASQALINKAIELNADAILVHHGYFWKNENPTITGIKQKRIKSLLAHDINLIAYHLPLDGHSIVGNNAKLGEIWGLEDITPDVSANSLVRLGRLPKSMDIKDFKQLVDKSLSRVSLHLPGGHNKVQTVAWCSGGAQGYIDKAIEWQADIYISGEVSEQTTHLALENNIHYLAAGHHATERLGVKALGEHLAEKFSLEVCFIDLENPV